jgi:hypothetical protein
LLMRPRYDPIESMPRKLLWPVMRLRYNIAILLAVVLGLVCCSKTDYPTQDRPAFLAESFHSGCKAESPEFGKLLRNGTIVLSSFDDTIRVVHASASYNCCADIKMEVTKTDYGFAVREKDEGFTCRCTCDFDITCFIYGLSAGTYLIKVFDPEGNLIDQGYVIVRPKDPSGPNG